MFDIALHTIGTTYDDDAARTRKNFQLIGVNDKFRFEVGSCFRHAMGH